MADPRTDNPLPLAAEVKREQAADVRDAVAEEREHRADERERQANDREHRADERDDRADIREAEDADREAEVEMILTSAEERDERADARDHTADRRDEAAVLEKLVFGTDELYPFRARREAAKDRESSRTDRRSAGVDRFLLSDVDLSQTSGEEADYRFLD